MPLICKAISIPGGSEGRKYPEALSSIFDVSDPWQNSRDVDSAWEVLRNDVLYLDYRARHDVLTIKDLHDKMVDVLNPVRRELQSVEELKERLAELQSNLEAAHVQVHASEARVEHTIQKLAEMESFIHGSVATDQASSGQGHKTEQKSGALDVSGPSREYTPQLKNFWYPMAFSHNLDSKTMIPVDCFDDPWVIFRGPDGRPGCIRDECAHRSCPLSLGTVEDGKAKCPYHGWEFNTTGQCEKMPSTKLTAARVKSLPCVEHDGMIWIWPGDATPQSILPTLSPPKGYTVHAEIVMELPVEHGLLVENLLDLAHAPFTHTTTFAKGWSVPNLVRFKTPAPSALVGHWDPYPIDMEFRPPCMVISTIGLAKPGQLDGKSTKECPKHLFQMHACIPSTKGKTRLLYRMALDFAEWVKYVPFIEKLWQRLANQVLEEDLRLVLGQQDRMYRGANVWNHPVIYDKLGVKYRRWRIGVEEGLRVPEEE